MFDSTNNDGLFTSGQYLTEPSGETCTKDVLDIVIGTTSALVVFSIIQSKLALWRNSVEQR